MRLFVIGATGRTGGRVVDVALARGHTVTAFVRAPHRVPPRDGLTVRQGDPRQVAELRAALPC